MSGSKIIKVSDLSERLRAIQGAKLDTSSRQVRDLAKRSEDDRIVSHVEWSSLRASLEPKAALLTLEVLRSAPEANVGGNAVIERWHRTFASTNVARLYRIKPEFLLEIRSKYYRLSDLASDADAILASKNLELLTLLIIMHQFSSKGLTGPRIMTMVSKLHGLMLGYWRGGDGYSLKSLKRTAMKYGMHQAVMQWLAPMLTSSRLKEEIEMMDPLVVFAGVQALMKSLEVWQKERDFKHAKSTYTSQVTAEPASLPDSLSVTLKNPAHKAIYDKVLQELQKIVDSYTETISAEGKFLPVAEQGFAKTYLSEVARLIKKLVDIGEDVPQEWEAVYQNAKKQLEDLP